MEGKGIRLYEPPAFDVREILRYAGCSGAPTESLAALVASCMAEAQAAVGCRVCFDTFAVSAQDGVLDLSFAKTRSADLQKNLAGCGRVVLFAATVGLALDRLIARYTRVAPSRALILQAIGAERIERLCDLFNDEIRAQALAEGLETRPRFSPGYGDLPLDLQREIFRTLDCSRRIGLTLNDSLLMSPSKSVTALIGIGPAGGRRGNDPCGNEA